MEQHCQQHQTQFAPHSDATDTAWQYNLENQDELKPTHKPFPNGPSTDSGATNCSVSRGYRFLAFPKHARTTKTTGLPRVFWVVLALNKRRVAPFLHAKIPANQGVDPPLSPDIPGYLEYPKVPLTFFGLPILPVPSWDILRGIIACSKISYLCVIPSETKSRVALEMASGVASPCLLGELTHHQLGRRRASGFSRYPFCAT
ncbi:hypothetical protein QBC36DRAFT_336722 [Triangularia setosa]|uniref:Uncharacterized protein n=1 Tax=Triangularia setosa TaxID=2587417 RepID=A0AAN7A4I2_9PEZI|nr:hypothetical protein QBC36DRAFT_336722 [Podospora setosa]